MGGPMQRMTPPRGMVPLGPQVNNKCKKPEAEFFAFILHKQTVLFAGFYYIYTYVHIHIYIYIYIKDLKGHSFKTLEDMLPMTCPNR